MKEFISCDWGTSAFRIRLVERESNIIAAEVRTDSGIASTYKLWQSNNPAADKFSFYKRVLSGHIAMLETQCDKALDNIAIVISGMASSSIGMIELPYKEIPFHIDGSDISARVIEDSDDFKHNMIIIPGVSSANDVMRGEETKLIGCDTEYNKDEQVFIFPGTHSKHIVGRNGIATDFKTYMTGELFDLLCNNSILSASVQKNNIDENRINPYFINGVTEGSASNFLNIIFHVRTN